MIDQRALRKFRLSSEYDELMCINGNVIQIEPIGSQPYERYRVTFHLRTIISPAPMFRDKTVCVLTIPPGYPEVAPKIAVDESSMPPPWHPNWYRSGTWCFGSWDRQESLASYLYRCAKTIQFDPEYTGATYDQAANKEAVVFWNENRSKRGIIPSDTKEVPILETAPTISVKKSVISILRKRQSTHEQEKPKINIKSRQ